MRGILLRLERGIVLEVDVVLREKGVTRVCSMPIDIE